MGVIGGSGGFVSGSAGAGPELTPDAADLLSDLGSIAKNAEPGWFGGFDRSSGVSQLGTKVVSDGRVTEREVRELVTEAYDYGAMTAPEKTALRSLLSRHGAKFDPAARAALARFLGVKDSRGSAPDNSLFAALRPGAASPTERDNLNSIDAGFDFWRHTESEGGTARAATAVKTAEKYLSTSLVSDWTVSQSDKSKAAAALEKLSPKEFLWALHQLWGEFRADGTSEASQTRSAFLFQPAQRAMTNKKLDQVEAYFENTIQDPKAREVALDYLTTMRTQAWPR
ncbi:MAG: hypothetical protein ACYS22_18780 [Planctomycetota bacterium]|jgi:hypothetical protein